MSLLVLATNSMLAAFNQTEQGRLQGGKGTGLGLALVRQIVKLSGGRLGVQSKVNEGSTFWVELRRCSLVLFLTPFTDLLTALGVGTKALPGLNSPTDIEEDDFGSPRGVVYSSGAKDPMPKVGPGRDVQNVRSSLHFNQSHSSSALHSIMEQGMADHPCCFSTSAYLSSSQAV